MALIGISGKIGSGKSTLAELIMKHDSDWTERSFAYKLKQITALVAGVDLKDTMTQEGKNILIPTFNMTVGQMLQKIGTEAMRDGLDREVWVKSLFAEYQPESKWIITDVRFKNEADYIKNMGGYLIRLEGDPADVRANSNRNQNHPSETDLDDYPDFDMIYHNGSGTLSLFEGFAMYLCHEQNRQKLKAS